ncbi:MAG: ribbon-helix-helix protein, CopG family [Armatimonadetes bacterium]|nr:ribbon-helix-helix protein, CopG family [Armatimonadota bacterium]
MKTVQMTLDEDLLSEVDRLARARKMTRSAFTREALRQALRSYGEKELEERHRRGYLEHPAIKGEFSIPEGDRAWGDKW